MPYLWQICPNCRNHVAMTGHDNFHSAMVAWLKIVLPLAALGLLSTLFLVSRTIDPNDAIPYSDVDIEDRLREPRLTLPTWAGVTDDGSAMTVSADEARPDAAEGNATARRLVVNLQTPDGGRADLVAAQGSLDQTTQKLTVTGGVTLSTSTGYRLETEQLTAALDRTSLTSDTAIQATGPAGTITANAMELQETAGQKGVYLLVFKNGVKLLYLPSK